MSPPPDRQDLRPLLRDEEPPAEGVVVVRGGPNLIERLLGHAQRTHDAYTLDGEPLWGVSVFCALDDVGPGSLDALLRRFASYRVVHLPTVRDLTDAGFDLLPSFRRPHYTVRLGDAENRTLTRLLDALGPAQPNPYHGRKRPGRS
jgi:hypothetical protein